MRRALIAFGLSVRFASAAGAQDVLPRPEQPFGGRIGITAQDSVKFRFTDTIGKVVVHLGDEALTPQEKRELDEIRGRGVMAE